MVEHPFLGSCPRIGGLLQVFLQPDSLHPGRAISRCVCHPRYDGRGCLVDLLFFRCLLLRLATVFVWVMALLSGYSAVVGGFGTPRDRFDFVPCVGSFRTGGWGAVCRGSPTLYLGRRKRAGRGTAGRRPRLGGRRSCRHRRRGCSGAVSPGCR